MARKDKIRIGSGLRNRRAFLREAPLISAALIAARQTSKGSDQAAASAPEKDDILGHLSGNEIIWFRNSGEDWNTQALHLGNGYFGASVIGNIEAGALRPW